MPLPENATRQQLFDVVAAHLLRQNKKSMDAAGFCMYRAPDGCKCAIGCLIPDEMYYSYLEKRGIRALAEHFIVPAYIYNPDNLPLLVALQRIHDTLSVEHWPHALIRTSARYGLEFNIDRIFHAPQT